MAARAKKLTSAIATVAALVLCAANPLGAPKPLVGEGGTGSRGEPDRLASLQQSTRPAQRIVSLVPALTEMLFAVGAGSQIAGVSSYDDFPPGVQSRPRVGALLDPDVERILSLKPDLVLVYGSQTDLEGQFARAGIRVYKYRHAGIANVLQTIRELGALSGHKDEGDRVAAQLQSQLDGIRARVRGRAKPRTMLVMERDAMALRGVYVSGGVGFLHELLDVAGAEDVFADVKREGVQPSNETMLVRAPQVIIELHAGDEPAPDVLQRERSVWSLLSSVPAVRNGRVYLLYGGYLVSPGPRLARAAESLARVLHPEAFK
jgi:iron complex transport system substrate-binding protein